ncbi:hypothetical protein PCK1_003071 [Pneumocystis canis]|nr:hypothetical protein PCK1_003071 [Pneumocystis canis]
MDSDVSLKNFVFLLKTRVIYHLQGISIESTILGMEEVGATSAPLKAASYFIGAYCQPFNDDFMLCKAENKGKGESACLKEGRRVTRCSIDLLQHLHQYCADSVERTSFPINESSESLKNPQSPWFERILISSFNNVEMKL